MSKATTAEITQRIADVFPLVVDFVPPRDICRYVSEKTAWGATVSTRQVERYIERCNREIKLSAAYDRTHELGGALTRLRRLYARAANRGDLTIARQVQKDITELLGLAAPQKVDIGGGIALSGKVVHVVKRPTD